MADEAEDAAYYLEEVSMDEDELDNLDPAYDDEDVDAEDDNFGAMLSTLKNVKAGLAPPPKGEPSAPSKKLGVDSKPTVMDDFFRNFLIKLNMMRTLDAFNTEWYELKEQGKLNEEDIGAVTDVYQRNENLDDQVKQLRDQVQKAHSIADKARGTWDKFRKERDFHRMHHRRVVQEKNILIRDMKRLQKHYSSFEPALKAMRAKYEMAMKDKMLMKLERDRTVSKMASVEAHAAMVEKADEASATPTSKKLSVDKTSKSSTKRTPGTIERPVAKEFNNQRRKGEATLPSDERINPHLNQEYEPMNAGRFALRKTYKGHQMAVSGVALHPTKPIVATVSDDRTWKMWSVQRGELIMSGDGHKDWIGSCDFHPGGSLLATASGDGTVKIWDFLQARCSQTFSDHTQAVWDCAFHDSGDFLVSASMDHTARLWDVASGRCRQTIRGHVDSVNRVCFQPFSNNICTASGDKTVSLWDIRSGLCIQTFYGHENAVLSATFNQQGDTIASADSDGIIKLWDVRIVAERLGLQTAGRTPVNDLKFDLSGRTLLAACDDATIKIYDATGEAEKAAVGQLDGHEGAVQALALDPKGGFIIGASADQTWRVFQP